MHTAMTAYGVSLWVFLLACSVSVVRTRHVDEVMPADGPRYSTSAGSRHEVRSGGRGLRVMGGRHLLQASLMQQLDTLPAPAAITPQSANSSIHHGHSHPVVTDGSGPKSSGSGTTHEDTRPFSHGVFRVTAAVTAAHSVEGHSPAAALHQDHPHPHPSPLHPSPHDSSPAEHVGGAGGGGLHKETLDEQIQKPLPGSGGAMPLQLPKKPAVVLARYNEDISWATAAVKSSSKAFNVFVYQSFDSAAPNFVPNRGFEATKYLKFILDHYDNLPPKVLFLHAHEKSSHNPCAPTTFLKRWDWHTKHDLVTIPATFKTFPYTGFSHWNTLKWTDLLRYGQEIAGLSPRPYNKRNTLTLPMNAQFMVSRRRILQLPRSVYQRLYDVGIHECNPPEWILERNPDRPFIQNDCSGNRLFGLAMEISLQAILSANLTSIGWVSGQKKCFSVCNNKDGVWCQTR